MTEPRRSPRRPPVALTIAGSDPSGGAGIQADLKTFSALGVYGTSVITALTAQNTHGVTGIHLVPAAFVAEQLTPWSPTCGSTPSRSACWPPGNWPTPSRSSCAVRPHDVVVLDPVMVATSGDRLLEADAVEAIRRLLPLAGLITPNLDEAADLLRADRAADVDGMLEQGRRLIGASAPAGCCSRAAIYRRILRPPTCSSARGRKRCCQRRG